jgi:hypothetical protein
MEPPEKIEVVKYRYNSVPLWLNRFTECGIIGASR